MDLPRSRESVPNRGVRSIVKPNLGWPRGIPPCRDQTGKLQRAHGSGTPALARKLPRTARRGQETEQKGKTEIRTKQMRKKETRERDTTTARLATKSPAIRME